MANTTNNTTNNNSNNKTYPNVIVTAGKAFKRRDGSEGQEIYAFVGPMFFPVFKCMTDKNGVQYLYASFKTGDPYTIARIAKALNLTLDANQELWIGAKAEYKSDTVKYGIADQIEKYQTRVYQDLLANGPQSIYAQDRCNMYGRLSYYVRNDGSIAIQITLSQFTRIGNLRPTTDVSKTLTYLGNAMATFQTDQQSAPNNNNNNNYAPQQYANGNNNMAQNGAAPQQNGYAPNNNPPHNPYGPQQAYQPVPNNNNGYAAPNNQQQQSAPNQYGGFYSSDPNADEDLPF